VDGYASAELYICSGWIVAGRLIRGRQLDTVARSVGSGHLGGFR